MAGMDVDSPPTHAAPISPRDRILQRLALLGVPQELLDESQPGLVDFLRGNKYLVPEVVSSILPTDEEVSEVRGLSKKDSAGSPGNVAPKDLLGESLFWLQWLMFEADPAASLQNLAEKAAGRRAVCGTVWGYHDLAYRCRTCEQDSTCAICVPCFQNGDHKEHDYSIMYTGGGCCDCGDDTAWKREGFCSQHKGAQQIQPLTADVADSVGCVLDALLVCWKDKVSTAVLWSHEREGDRGDGCVVAANEMTLAVVEMLHDFCNCTESLLSFISRRMFQCTGLLEVLVRSERVLDKKVVRKLHELLLKLLGEPLFKYELAKVFVKYYPSIVNAIVKESSDSMPERYPVLSTFSVQIFTVPTLTSRLVREVNLLGVLIGCLRDLFLSCVDENGRLQATRWANVYGTSIRLVEDTRYVMSHAEVPKYIAAERPDISKTWIWLLSLVQGMNAQKRVTGLITEEENENLPAPFGLAHYLGNVSKLMVEGAFSVEDLEETKDAALCCSDTKGSDDGDTQRHAKVGKLSLESSACSTSRNSLLNCALPYGEMNLESGSFSSIPSSVVWLIFECLKAIESWLGPDTAVRIDSSSLNASSSSGGNMPALRKKLFRIRKGSNSSRPYRASISRMDTDELHETHRDEYHQLVASSSSSSTSTHVTSGSREVGRGGILNQNNISTDDSGITKFYPEDADIRGVSDDSLVELESGSDLEAYSILNLADWPDILYNVSSQEVSFHIPLHRLLSLLLRKAMRVCFSETEKMDKANDISALPSSGHHHDFFGKVLGLQPCGFSAFVMEHPLRLRVLCAQVRAGMWRKNGDTAILSSEWYRSVQWLEQGLESDLFLLQCCAALAPPELFVKRIQERFGLSNYTSLDLAYYNEHESVLLQEMLTLIIQIVQERRFCGLTTTENLRRELVYKLATGDATHSQLVKALPRDLSKSDQLQNVLEMLAVYSYPSGLKQGKYSLNKTHWKDLDLYHPRWNSKDLQTAEERYLCFCKVSALNVQLPRWTGVFEPLKNISGIATSKAVFGIVHAVLFYALFTERSAVSRAPGGVLITALHLLSLALDICEKKSQIFIDKIGADVGTSHLEDRPYVDSSHCAEDVFPILSCASEESDAGAANDAVFRKNQSMLSLLVSLMKKHKEEGHNNYAETRQCNIFSFIVNILKKFAQLSSICMSTLERLAPDVVFRMPHYSPNTNSQNPASGSDFEKRRAKARERQAAILEKMRAEQSKFIASLESAPSEEPDTSKSKQEVSYREADCVTEESTPVCSLCRDSDSQSPLCFLVLLQKSRLTSFVERGPPSWEHVDQSDKDILPVSKEGRIDVSATDSTSPVQLAQNADLEFAYDVEPAEVDAFLDFFKDRLPDIGNIVLPNVSYDTCTNTPLSLELMENDIYQSVKGDMHDIVSHSDPMDIEHKCSTSHIARGSNGSKNVEPSVLGEYVSSLSRARQHQRSMYDLLHMANASSRSVVPSVKYIGFGPRDCDGIHISSCGHAVHQECHDRYVSSLRQRNIRRLGFEVGHIVDPDMGELLCPVCRRFANSILPIFPGVSNKIERQEMRLTGSPTSYEAVSSDMDNNIMRLPLALSLLQSTSKIVGQGRFLKVFSRKLTETIEPALEPALRKLCMLYYPNSYGNLSASGRLSQSLILWDTLRYSLASTEIACRGKLKTGTGSSVSCLKILYGELQYSSGFILSLLLGVAHNTRSLNYLEVLLRFRGIQLLAGSICSGVLGDNNYSNSDKRRGTFSSVLEHADKGETFPDIQFWNRAADPILAHDPFSSLMWVLFCLPLPFISSVEFFIPLVHLFYVVSVVQAVITCYSQQHFDISSFGGCLLHDVCKTLGESELARKYFISNNIDLSCHPKDMIRRLTFPYLRRCALLWKLLQSSSLTLLFSNPHTWEESNLSMNNDTMDCTDHLTIELNGIRELEDMFQINSLESVLKDDNTRDLALKWCGHFRDEFKARNFGGILFCTPAVPFKLMQLPRVYQDLLQRYIKGHCSDCKSVPDEPALCLLCGKLCSPSWKPCCRASRCLNHALVCGAGIGVFLLVRKTTILLQRCSRQAVWPSPYLDAFGEEDLDMYRGKPLYLSDERDAALTYLVASHGLDRSSEVLRQTTISLYGPE